MRNSNFSTLYIMLLKEIRLDRGIHQGYLAQATGKSPNAWTKIENGQSTLTADTMLSSCYALQMAPSVMFSIIETLIPFFSSSGFYFHPGTIKDDEDDLLYLVLNYFNSPGFARLRSMPGQIINIATISDPYKSYQIPTLVRYCTDDLFQQWINDGAPSIANY